MSMIRGGYPMDTARYVIARLVPNVLRNEMLNVGIIFQSDDRVSARFVPSLPKRLVPDELLREYVKGLSVRWDEQLSNREQLICLPGWEHPQRVSTTSPEYLQWLHDSWGVFLQFTEAQTVETTSLDSVQFEIIMDELFEALVSRRRRKGAAKGLAEMPRQNRDQVKRRVQQAFRTYGIEQQFRPSAQVKGKIVSSWPFDWAHLNESSGILIDTVWLGHSIVEHNIRDAAYVSAKARDVRDAGDYEIHAVMYTPDGREQASIREARDLLEREDVLVDEVFRANEFAQELADKLITRTRR
jgi:hypothetical protein